MDTQKRIDQLSRERLLPSPRVAVISFLIIYTIIAVLRNVVDSPAPFFAGILTTTILAIYLAKAVLVRILRRDLMERPGGPIMAGTLTYRIVLFAFMPIYLLLLVAFIYAYWHVG